MIRFEQVSKRFGAFQALTEVTGMIAAGERVVLCGPSGSGKSTLIRTVNRLETVDAGRVLVSDADVNDPKLDINRFRRRIGFVPQQYSLFPHLTALGNVAIGLFRLQKLPRARARAEAMERLTRFGLASRANVYPADLSGGECQRVAIVRAMSMDPEILLLDEPTSALDPELVGDVLALLRLLASEGVTMICATHEMDFAREVADQVWFMEAGRLLAAAPSVAFFADPPHPRARQFLARLR